uniref:Exostosin GT47 domain-containing protein n=1 Tax=Chenopodium quinoa TaxID=63459 RepID=A0A803KYW0_CHEQI
ALGFLLLRFSLPDFAYISSYANAIRQPVDAGKLKSSWKSQQQDPCLGRYIYMHDLPSRFNQDLVTKCQTLRKQFNLCPYVENGGFGTQLKLNASSEDSESVMSGESCSSIKDAGALDFTNWLRGRPEWERMFGWDHFFVSGRVTWDFRRPTYIGPNWGSKLMNLPETKNMTMVSVEASPYANNDFAVPYPTDFHPSNDSEVLQWQEKVRKTRRAHLFAFAGATRSYKGSIRGELIRQCKNAPGNQCKLVSCVPKNKANCNNPANIIKAFLMSDFCLQPTGDSDTRRSTFDAILTGCIPVFFHPGSDYTQYFWHLPKNYTSYSVFIPMEGIQNGMVHVEEVLHQISQDVVTAMREKVIGLIPSIIYARYKLKIEDAFDITVKGVLKRIEDVRRQIHEGKDPRSRFPEELTWKHYLTGKLENHEWDSFFRSKQ